MAKYGNRYNMISTTMKTIGRIFAAGLLVATATTAGLVLPARAETPNLATAKVSFTFDDGLASSYTQAAPTLAKYGLTGTNYVTTGCVGMTRVPNTCHANTQAKYLSWAQVRALTSTYGWEIGSHTVTHPYLATSDAGDGQPQPLTQAQVIQEISKSKTDLAARGITATAFSTPYGDYDNFTRQTIAKYYSSHRGFADTNDNVWPYNDTLLNNTPVQVPISVDTVKAKIDYAITNNRWLILTFHDIMPTPSADPNDYQYATRDLDAIAAYVKSKQAAGLIQNVNVSNGLVKKPVNLMPNPSFNSGIASGWTTDKPTMFTTDSGSNGNFPDATKSIKIASASTHGHLFSPRISVDRTNTYVIKNYLNVQNITSGEVGFYIDEFDASGNWVSGQYKGRENSSYVESMNFTYQPSSIMVKSASLQIYSTADSGITAFLDNVEWFQIASTVPEQTNIMPNPNFDAGLAGGWVTDDSANIHADAANHGSPQNAVHSISLNARATSGNTHLFAPALAVDTTKTYYLENYLNITQKLSGDVSFYIDEYDASGNWVSGQYKTSISALGGRDVSFTYKPSSSAVSNARLQIIVPGGSNLSAYFDYSRWTVLN